MTINLSVSQGILLVSVILAASFLINGVIGIVTKRTVIQFDRDQYGKRVPWIQLVYEGVEVGILNFTTGIFILVLGGMTLLPESSRFHLPANRAIFYEIIATILIQAVVVVMWVVKSL